MTIGLAAGLIVAVFWGGVSIGGALSRVDGLESASTRHATSITELETKAVDHEVRLKSVERLERVAAN